MIATTSYLAIYTLACCLEIGRFWRPFKSPAARIAARRLSIVAFVIHTVYLGFRLVTALAARGLPLANWSDWCLLASWMLALGFILLAQRRPGFGVFLLPLVLALIAITLFLPTEPGFQKADAARWLGLVHGVALLLGTVSVLFGFSAGLMYLLQSRQLKRKEGGIGFRLPSLEYLQHANERALVCSAFLLVLGMVTGIVLNLTIASRTQDPLPWNDPTVLISALLAVWMMAAWIFSATYRPALHSRKVAYLTVASFVALAMTLSIVLFGPSSHARKGDVLIHDTSATSVEELN